MLSAKFIVVTALLVSTLAVLSLRSDRDRVPPRSPLWQLPQRIGPWQSRDFPLSAEVLKVLGDGQFLNRMYTESAPAGEPAPSAAARVPAGPVGLFIAYFPTQRTGQAIHSPQNCLPGAGWTFLSAHPMLLKDGNGRSYDIGEYLVTDGTAKQEVLYWYQAHGRSISSEYRAKFYMIADALRYNRTDGALIRVITPLQPGESERQAHDRAVEFTADLAPLLPAYIPN